MLHAVYHYVNRQIPNSLILVNLLNIDWHNVIDLESLEPPLIRKRGITRLVRGAVGVLLSLDKQRKVKRRGRGR